MRQPWKCVLGSICSVEPSIRFVCPSSSQCTESFVRLCARSPNRNLVSRTRRRGQNCRLPARNESALTIKTVSCVLSLSGHFPIPSSSALPQFDVPAPKPSQGCPTVTKNRRRASNMHELRPLRRESVLVAQPYPREGVLPPIPRFGQFVQVSSSGLLRRMFSFHFI